MQEAQAHIRSEQSLNIVCGEGASREMEDIVSRRMRSLYRSAYKFLGNAADAEDAVQDALLSAYKHLDQFRGQSQMSTWLTAIVNNSARMQLRRRPRQVHVSLDERIGEEQEYLVSERLANHDPNPEDECRNSEANARLREFVKQLSPSLRKAFQLRDLDGLTTAEAARVLGVADGTLKAQLSRARAKLKQLIRRTLDSTSDIAEREWMRRARHRIARPRRRRSRVSMSARRRLLLGSGQIHSRAPRSRR
jgi:RNA polymerase sigma-70 factor (ECF subfamily)